MVRPKCIQPLAQAVVDHILDRSDHIVHLPIALATTSCWLLVHNAEYLTQVRKAPLELRPMVHLDIPWFTPPVHDAF